MPIARVGLFPWVFVPIFLMLVYVTELVCHFTHLTLNLEAAYLCIAAYKTPWCYSKKTIMEVNFALS
jgi:hypothetical protein